jgi:hypothetical protein
MSSLIPNVSCISLILSGVRDTYGDTAPRTVTMTPCGVMLEVDRVGLVMVLPAGGEVVLNVAKVADLCAELDHSAGRMAP